MHHNKNLPIDIIFERVRSLDGTIEDKANLLKVYDRRDIRWVVDFMYNADKSLLTVPEYKECSSPHGISYMTMLSAIPRLNAAITYSRTNPKLYERNIQLILENVTVGEASVLVTVLSDRKIEGISKAVFKKAYPQFFLLDEQLGQDQV